MAEFKLYYRPGSGSMVVEAALRIAGVAFKGIEIADKARLRDAEYLAINPAGKIPALALPTGQVIAESAAILLMLDDMFPTSGLLPQHGSGARNTALQWLIILATNIYPAALRYYYPSRHTADGTVTAAEAVKAAAAREMDRDFALFAAAVQGPFLLGETMTITDVYAGMLADLHAPAMEIPAMRTLVSHMLEIDPVREAWKNHGFGM